MGCKKRMIKIIGVLEGRGKQKQRGNEKINLVSKRKNEETKRERGKLKENEETKLNGETKRD